MDADAIVPLPSEAIIEHIITTTTAAVFVVVLVCSATPALHMSEVAPYYLLPVGGGTYVGSYQK